VRFSETSLPGAFVVELEQLGDERGFFARSFCVREFEEHGLDPYIAQCNVSHNLRKGTLRGMHYQVPPAAETKLVRCTRGAIYDVIIDLRPDSPAYCKWQSFELSVANGRALYIPEGFAHGFQTLEDDSDVLYQMSEYYAPGQARGVRWDDPAFGIEWPVAGPIMSEKDRAYEDFRP
jgi:dTDP-4-dehydrorhamnose 3,5-epimerase